MNSRNHSRLALLLAAMECALLAGCERGPGYEHATVSGQVSIDGEPVASGYVTFSPIGSQQGPVTGAAIEGGRYRCERVPVGKHRVTFVAHAAEPTTVVDHATGETRQVPKDIVPPRYASGVEADMGKGQVVLDFVLNSDE